MKLTYSDIVELRSRAIAAFKTYHSRTDIEGAPAVGLSESDIQALAWLDASAQLINSKKLTGEFGRQGIVPSVWEE